MSVHPILVALYASRIATSFFLLALSTSLFLLKPALGSIQLRENATSITVISPRRGLILILLSLVSLAYFSDGLVLILHSVITKTWQGTPDFELGSGSGLWHSKWPGLDIEAVVGLFASSLLSCVGIWKEYQKIAVWTTWRPKLWAIVALIGSLIELWCLFAGDAYYRKGPQEGSSNLPTILHTWILILRLLLLLLLFATLVYPRVKYVPIKTEDEDSAGSSTDNGASASNSNSSETQDAEEQVKDMKKNTDEGKKSFKHILKGVIRLTLKLWPKGKVKLHFFLVVCLITIVIERAINPAIPFTFGRLVDALEKNYNNSDPADGDKPSFWTPLIAYVVMQFLTGTGGFMKMRMLLWSPFAWYTERKLAELTYTHLLSLSLTFHMHRKTGELIKILDRGSVIDTLFSWMFFTVGPAIIDIAVAIGILKYVFDKKLAVILSMIMFTYAIFSITFTRRVAKVRRQAIEKYNDAGAMHTDTILNYETVKYFCGEAYEINRYRDAVRITQRSWFKVQLSNTFMSVVQNMIMSTGYLLGGIIIALRVSRGESKPSDFVAFNMYIFQLFSPLNIIISQYSYINTLIVDAEKLIDLLEQPMDIEDKPDAKDLIITNGEIEFDNVQFAYDTRTTALKGISFKVPKGSSVALVGASGSGKSTILRLLYRFYDLKEGDGRILIDGQDIREVTQLSLRKAIGIVPQEPVLFNNTIKHNIEYGKLGSSQEVIEEATRAARMHDKIMSFPDGYETTVGERGVRLSGGEKQRVAIARTLVKDPPILVLDEATSALDTSTEKDIQSALQRLMQGRSTLCVAHRLSTIASVNLILVFKDGQIVEQGTHRELLARNGHFAKMWADQVSVVDPGLVPTESGS